jgi:hypothetical protein
MGGRASRHLSGDADLGYRLLAGPVPRSKEQIMRHCGSFSKGKANLARLRFISSQARVAHAACSIIVGLVLFGCDSFIPPKPDELSDAAGTVPAAVTDTFQARPTLDGGVSQSKSIDVVLGPHNDDEVEIWKGAIRTQAGLEKARFRLLGPPEPPVSRADLVREAMSRHPGVLLVDASAPVDPPLLAAIKDAQRQGTPVVLVGRLPASETTDSKAASAADAKSEGSADRPAPLVVVAPQSFEVPAKHLVESALKACRQSDFDPGKSAILLVNTTRTAFMDERALGIKEALNAAGVTSVEELPISANDKAGAAALEAKLKANPAIFMIFTVDSLTSTVIREIVKDDADHRFFVAAGYVSDELKVDLGSVIKFTSVADFSATRVMRKGVITAAAVAQGHNVPPLVEVPINVTDSLATPAMLRAEALQWKGKAEQEKAKKK